MMLNGGYEATSDSDSSNNRAVCGDCLGRSPARRLGTRRWRLERRCDGSCTARLRAAARRLSAAARSRRASPDLCACAADSRPLLRLLPAARRADRELSGAGWLLLGRRPVAVEWLRVDVDR